MGSLLRGACGKLLKCAGGALRMCKHTEPGPTPDYCQWRTIWAISCNACSGGTWSVTATPSSSYASSSVDPALSGTIVWTSYSSATSYGAVYNYVACPSSSDAPTPTTLPSGYYCDCDEHTANWRYWGAVGCYNYSANCSTTFGVMSAYTLKVCDYPNIAVGGCTNFGDPGHYSSVKWTEVYGPFCTQAEALAAVGTVSPTPCNPTE